MAVQSGFRSLISKHLLHVCECIQFTFATTFAEDNKLSVTQSLVYLWVLLWQTTSVIELRMPFVFMSLAPGSLLETATHRHIRDKQHRYRYHKLVTASSPSNFSERPYRYFSRNENASFGFGPCPFSKNIEVCTIEHLQPSAFMQPRIKLNIHAKSTDGPLHDNCDLKIHART